MTTGFGATCRAMVTALAGRGWAVACFGLSTFGETFDRAEFPCRIWTAGQIGDRLPMLLAKFMAHERPSVVVVNGDPATLNTWTRMLRSDGWTRPIIGHVVLDGFPLYARRLEGLRALDSLIVPTAASAAYLRTEGLEAIVAPHGVSPLFRPLPGRAGLRAAVGIGGEFVVGVFGRNTERKQIPRVIDAAAELRSRGELKGVRLIIHCARREPPHMRGWDINDLVTRAGLGEHVHLTAPDFDHVAGVPPTAYVEWLNRCDLIVNPASSGGFELGIIEAQACGVPVAVTDDGGNMSEVAGGAAMLLPASDTAVGWEFGSRQHHVAPAALADAIQRFRDHPAEREGLIEAGLANAARFHWGILGDAVCAEADRAA